MEYSIQKLAKLSGVTTRTLRYYDEMGLLKPVRLSSSGYRIYGQVQVNLLQQILFYRELGVPLDDIKGIVTSPGFDAREALVLHRAKLLEKRAQIETLIANVERTLAASKGEYDMSDNEKFEGFKQKMIDDNEKQYGTEIRQKYGDEAVNRSNKKIKNMSKEDHDRITALGEEILTTLEAALDTGDPAGELAQKAADLHRQWLSFYWDGYTKEAHAGIAQMYVDDERFTAYYDKRRPGMAAFLRDAVLVYTGTKQ